MKITHYSCPSASVEKGRFSAFSISEKKFRKCFKNSVASLYNDRFFFQLCVYLVSLPHIWGGVGLRNVDVGYGVLLSVIEFDHVERHVLILYQL